MERTRAVVVDRFGPPEVLTVREVAHPVPKPDEALIDVAAAGVNYPDVLVVGGTYQILPPLPFTPGKELAGTVREVGAQVSDLRPGQRVLAQVEYGAFQERVAVPAAQVVPLPGRIGFAEAAAFGLGYLTAHFALVRRARLDAGETVLVTGAGGSVAAATIQLAKAFGATVIAAGRGERHRELAAAQGADQAIPVDPEALRDRVRELTGGRGADVVVELVGGAVFREALRATAWEGRLVVTGFASGEIPTIKAGHVLVKNISVLGLQVSDYRDREPAAARAALTDMLALHEAGRLRVPVAGTYPLSRAADALAAVRAGGVQGNLVLIPE